MRNTLLQAILTVLFAAAACGQTTYATLTGFVSDPSGAAVANVEITVRQIETNLEARVRSNEAGIYTASQLRPGTYAVRAASPGFAEFAAADVLLEARAIRRLDIAMRVGEMVQKVEVTEGAALIETETSKIGDTRTAKQITTLPVVSRSLIQYRVLGPGAVQGTGSSFSYFGSGVNQVFSTIDGTTDNGNGDLTQSLDWIQEFKVDVVGNSAEFGTLSNLTVVSKSGTNDLHGAAHWYYSSPVLRARNPFAVSKGSGIAHQLGAALGGPIFVPKVYDGRNRTFFHSTYYANRGSSVSSQLSPTVPLEAWRNGDFSGLGIQIRNPFTGEVYPNGRIPASLINPVAKKVQERFYPLPNFGNPNVLAAGNFRQTVSVPWKPDSFWTARLDQRLGSRDFVFSRYQIAQTQLKSWDGGLPTIGPLINFRRTKALTASYSHMFGPRATNELRYGYMYGQNPQSGPVSGLDLVKTLGLTGLAPNLPDVGGILRVGFTGLGITGTSQTNWRFPGFLNKIHQLNDQVNVFLGRHSLKMGIDFRNTLFEQLGADNSLFGNVTFANTYSKVPGVANSGHAYADFLFGVPTSAVRNFPPILISYAQPSYDLYFQDDFKVTPRLTLNVGMRYELHPPNHATDGRLAMFDLASGKIVVPDDGLNKVSPLMPKGYVDVVSASSVGLPSTTLMRTDRNNFAPRFGFAWRPTQDNRTVVRGGFGVYFNSALAQLPGQATSVPFNIAEPGYTNTQPNPAIVLPQVFPATSTGGPSTVTLPVAIDPNLRMPYSMQSNVTIEHQRWDTGFRLSYVSTLVRQIPYTYNANSPAADERLFINKARRFPQYPAISVANNGSVHNYHGLSAELERKMKHGLLYQFTYTLARDIGDEVAGSIENPLDRRRERGPSQFIPRQRATFSGIYQVPVGRGRKWLGQAPRAVDALLGGWELAAITYMQTGHYLTPTITVADTTGTAYVTSGIRPNVTIRPDRIADGRLSNPTIDRWFDASAFVAPPVGRFGSSGRGVIIGPGVNVWHAGFLKYFRFSDNPRMPKVRIELTSNNIFNHPNWGNPNMSVSSAATVGTIRNVGSINGSGDQAYARNMEARLRIEW